MSVSKVQHDGASNMNCHVSGIAAKIPQEEPTTLFVHCLANSPNMCLQTSAKHIAPTKEALELTKELGMFINFSPKQSHLFHTTQAQFFFLIHMPHQSKCFVEHAGQYAPMPLILY